MLNKTQLEKLQALTTDQKYGKLLEDAIKTWSSEIDVGFHDFGTCREFSSIYYPDGNKKCCLIGASLIGKERRKNESFGDAIRRFYEISYCGYVWSGFDCDNQRRLDDNKENEDFMFGYTVRQILIENKFPRD